MHYFTQLNSWQLYSVLGSMLLYTVNRQNIFEIKLPDYCVQSEHQRQKKVGRNLHGVTVIGTNVMAA